MREAENGGEFLHAIVSQTGIRAKVISGTEEARLIQRALLPSTMPQTAGVRMASSWQPADGV